MALEVVGSNPTIYLFIIIISPSLNKEIKFNNIKLLKIYTVIYYYVNTLWKPLNWFFNRPYNKTIYYINYNKITLPFTPKNNIHKKANTNYKVPRYKRAHTKTLYNYLKLTLHTYTSSDKIHHSFKTLYIQNSTKGAYIVNISKLLDYWLRVQQLVYNLFFYNISITTFGTVFFRNETYSLNWIFLSKLKLPWRYTKLFFFLLPITATPINYILPKLLITLGLRNSIILDILYHKTTIKHLHKVSIFTLGLVPTLYDSKSVSLAVPIHSDNIFTQLFFVKLLIRLRSLAEKNRYNLFVNTWSTTFYCKYIV